MNTLDRLIVQTKSKLPKYIVFKDAEGNIRKMEWVDFLLGYLKITWCGENNNVPFIPDSEIADVISQMESMPSGHKGILFRNVLEELRERETNVS